MKLFQKVNMASETIHSAMRSGIVYANDKTNKAKAGAGDIVIPFGYEVNDVYGIVDENMMKVIAPVLGTETNLFVLDPVLDPVATNGDLVYRIGVRTLGIEIPAGQRTAMRQLFANDIFYLGADNFESVPVAGEKFGISAGKTTLKKVESGEEAAAAVLFRVDLVTNLQQGVGVDGVVPAYLVTVEKI